MTLVASLSATPHYNLFVYTESYVLSNGRPNMKSTAHSGDGTYMLAAGWLAKDLCQACV